VSRPDRERVRVDVHAGAAALPHHPLRPDDRSGDGAMSGTPGWIVD